LKDAEKSRETINAWVEKKTEKRITDLIPSGSLDQDTRLVLVNAIYFLADWQHPFDKARTQPDDFIVSASNKVRAQMMHHEASYNFAEVDGAKLLELPYKGGEMSMLVALPNEADGIAKLEKGLSADKIAEWSKAMKSERVKFATGFEVNPSKATKLDDALKLGMSWPSTARARTSPVWQSRRAGRAARGLPCSQGFVKREKGHRAAADQRCR
jgi:serpin B